MGYGIDGEYIWAKDQIPQWGNLIKELSIVIDKYIVAVDKCISAYGNEKEKQLFSMGSIERFSILKKEMIDSFDDNNDGQRPDIPMKQWILLGAVTETALQMFLSVFHSDYLNENWQQWKDFDGSAVHGSIDGTLKELIAQGTISSKQSSSLLGAIDDKIIEHSALHEVNRIMLDELITLYEKADIMMDSDYVKCLRNIQHNRNCIHAYAERSIDGWDDLWNSVNMFGCIVSDLKNRIPTPEDE